MDKKKQIVIVGGGFAGISFLKEIDTKLFDVILIDKLNHHQFQPLFYQVATSQLEPSSISFPFRYIFRNNKEIRIRLANVNYVDVSTNKIHTSIGEFQYDYLILAMGCGTNFFGNDEISKHAYTLKSTYDAITIRNQVLQNFEDIINDSENKKEELLNIVIVGAGPTGVELAGSFAEIKENILPRDFHRIDFSRLKIYLIEGSKNTLNSMSEKSQSDSRRYLKKLGVEVFTETTVKSYDGEALTTDTGKIIKTKFVIWAAGIIANPIEGIPKEAIRRGNRLKVDRVNKLDNSENIFVLGDMAYMETPNYPTGHPQLANVAINQGKNLAKNLKRIELAKPLKEYEYNDLGTMATIGRNKSVVDLPFVHLKGFFAWLIWMFLHLMLILSVRNKLIVFINWTWAYITKNTALRIIIKDNSRL
jgi:NADH:ubiquinone reductase (H+-translocating)